MYVAIEAEQLAKVYAGGTEALRDVTFHVDEGEIFGYLGRNGGGKTTTVRILTGLTRPTGGRARVAGLDVVSRANELRSRIGVTLQEAALDELLTGREFLTLVASLWGMSHRAARARADELLDLFDLAPAAGRRVGTYSGGMHRRLDLAAALVRRPEVLFLDEPTTGLDPQSRRTLWDEIRRLRGEGTTVFLTTQYLEEAEALADRLAVVHEGRIVALGTPEALRARLGRTVLRLRTTPEEAARAATRLAGRAQLLGAGTVQVDLDGPDDALEAAAALAALGLQPEDIEIRRPSLEDVFLALTGVGSSGSRGVTAVDLAPAAHATRRFVAGDEPSNPPWRTAWLAFRREAARARRRFGMAWVFPVVPPILTITLFSALTGSVANLPGFPAPSYADWMTPGAVVLPGMTGAGFTAVGLAEDLRGGLSQRLRLVGAAPAAVTAGRLAFDAARVLPAAALVLGVAILISEDVRPSPGAVAGLLGLAAAWAVAWNMVFHLVARLAASPQAPQALLPLFAPVTFLSTLWLPAELMPAWAQRVAEANPVSAVVEAARQWTAGTGETMALAGGVAVIVVWSCVLAVALTTVERRRR